MTVISLNKVRKQKQRIQRKALADENSAKFGRTKQQRTADQAVSDRLNKTLNHAKREPCSTDQTNDP